MSDIMTSHSAALRIDRDKRLGFILSFASDLPNRLSFESDPRLATELQSSILPEFPIKAPRLYAARFDAKGTELWNIVIREHRQLQNEGAKAVETLDPKIKGVKKASKDSVLALVKVFAAFLVDAGYTARDIEDEGRGLSSGGAGIRIIKVLMNAARSCLWAKEYAWGTKMLERAAEYIARFEDGTSGKLGKRMMAEFLILRVFFASKQSNLDLARHMFNQIDLSILHDVPDAAEELADALYSTGVTEFKSKHPESAAEWFEYSLNAISSIHFSKITENATNLKISAMQLVTKSYLNVKTKESMEKAKHMLGLMDVEFDKDEIIVLLLQLDFIKSSPTRQLESEILAFHGILIRLFKTMQMTQENFITLMHNVNKLRALSPDIACKALDDFLNLRLFSERNTEYMDQAVILRIWITVTFLDQGLAWMSLMQFLETLERNTKAPLDSRTADAAQSLIWKSIELHLAQSRIEPAKELCQLALHPLFENAGEENKAKLCRKTILCALNMNDHNLARKSFYIMSKNSQNHLQSQFLLYKIALRSSDDELASTCLNFIAKHSENDTTLIYACVLDAQKTGNKSLASQALQEILERYDSQSAEGVHLPALLRCILKLKQSELVKEENMDEGLIEVFSKIFERAAQEASRSKSETVHNSNGNWNELELEWFSRNCYNFAVEHCATLPPTHLYRMARACLQFLDSLMKTCSSNTNNDGLQRRYILVQYLCMLSSLVLARSSQNIEISGQHYLLVREHAKLLWHSITLFVELKVSGSSIPSTDREGNLQLEMRTKFTDAVKYSLEACLRLRKWEDLDSILKLCLERSDLALEADWSTFADLGFLINQELDMSNSGQNHGRSKSWNEKVLEFVSKTIRSASSTKSPNLLLLARYIRTIFTITLSSQPQLATNLVDHVLDLVKRFPTLSISNANTAEFPTSTIEYMSTLTFNHAVDCFSNGDDVSCREWSARAMALAKTLENTDGGSLKSLLSDKIGMLLLGGKEREESRAGDK